MLAKSKTHGKSLALPLPAAPKPNPPRRLNRDSNKMKSTTSKSVTALIQAIVNDGCGIYTTDDGNGCAGPMYRDERDLRQMLADEAGDEYEIVDKTRRGIPASQVIRDTLEAHDHDINDGTAWLLAEKVDAEGSNPYTHYLLLWEV